MNADAVLVVLIACVVLGLAFAAVAFLVAAIEWWRPR
jgi:hypothetical protein